VKAAVTAICGEPTTTGGLPAVAVIVTVPGWPLVGVTVIEQAPLTVWHDVKLSVGGVPVLVPVWKITVVPSATGLLVLSFTVAMTVSVTPAAIVFVLVLPPSIVRVEFDESGGPGMKVIDTGLPGVPEISVSTPPTFTVTVTE
jgi:hypothetical protein